jgi:hypothetical protein
VDPDLLPERFRKKFVVSTEHFYKGTPCWEWQRARLTGGYGAYFLKGRNVYTHRFAYEQLVGPVPGGLQLDHLCRNTRCVNPVHLEPVTPRENKLRGTGITAINAKKTHCVRSHEFTPENTYIYPNGKRSCRTCIRWHGRRFRRAQRAANPEASRQGARSYYRRNSDKLVAARREYVARNREAINTRQRERNARKKAEATHT